MAAAQTACFRDAQLIHDDAARQQHHQHQRAPDDAARHAPREVEAADQTLEPTAFLDFLLRCEQIPQPLLEARPPAEFRRIVAVSCVTRGARTAAGESGRVSSLRSSTNPPTDNSLSGLLQSGGSQAA